LLAFNKLKKENKRKKCKTIANEKKQISYILLSDPLTKKCQYFPLCRDVDIGFAKPFQDVQESV